jgi:PKD repeat protein
MERESAVSRNIFLALIVSVVIIVAAVVIVFVLFPPAPVAVPAFSANAERSGTLVYLYHDGGDPLQERTTAFRINGMIVPKDAVSFLHGQNWPWTEGETIRIDDPAVGSPGDVEVLYTGGKTGVVVYSSQFTALPATTPVTPVPSIMGAQTPVQPTGIPATPAIPPTMPVSSSTTPITVPATPVTTSTGTGPRPPVALFSASPREGTAPLQVQFTDLSSGSPDQWIWNFGDGSGANEKNPSHLYPEPGNYTVSLAVSNSFGSNTRIQSSEIVVASTAMHEVYLQQSSTGYLLPDGYFQFVVTGPGASIKIGGPEYQFHQGDLVQLFPGDVSSGSITVNQNGIVGFSFTDVRMLVNGKAVRAGTVSGISVPSYSGLKSTFTIVIPPGDASMQLFVDATKVPPSYPEQITISGLGADSSGSMFLSTKTMSITFHGGAEGYVAS